MFPNQTINTKYIWIIFHFCTRVILSSISGFYFFCSFPSLLHQKIFGYIIILVFYSKMEEKARWLETEREQEPDGGWNQTMVQIWSLVRTIGCFCFTLLRRSHRKRGNPGKTYCVLDYDMSPIGVCICRRHCLRGNKQRGMPAVTSCTWANKRDA